jgi:hypothetical protein
LKDKSDLEEAAVKIQAAFRGHQTRNNMKQPGKHEETEPSPQQLEEEFRADDTGKNVCTYWAVTNNSHNHSCLHLSLYVFLIPGHFFNF